ncbi:MAG: dTDP-4-dehydrorhamnose 3,5-epimerase [Candidatus Anstonellales archaeon]
MSKSLDVSVHRKIRSSCQKYFKIEKLPLKGAYLIKPFIHKDKRGLFLKLFEDKILEKLGFTINEFFFSINKKNVLRGLHYLSKPQSRLIFCLSGKVFDVIVDIRKNSKTYGKWHGLVLSDKDHTALFIPKGFAHGFLSLEKRTILLYFTDGHYNKKLERGIAWNDPQLNIKWPLKKLPIISNRDMRFPLMKDLV